jgi:hypothetical protein
MFELEFRNVHFFWREENRRTLRKTRRKTLEARERINNSHDVEYKNRTRVTVRVHTATLPILPLLKGIDKFLTPILEHSMICL